MDTQEFKLAIEGTIATIEMFNAGVRIRIFRDLIESSKSLKCQELIKLAEEIHKRDKLPAQIVHGEKLGSLLTKLFYLSGVQLIQSSTLDLKDHQYTFIVMWDKPFGKAHRDIIFGPWSDPQEDELETKKWADKFKENPNSEIL